MDQVVQEKKKWYLRWYMWIVYVVLAFIILSSMGGSSKSNVTSGSNNSAATQQEAIKVTSTQIVSDYKDNEVAADAKYKGRLVEVSGTVETIGKDITDTPYIALQSYQYAIVDKVQCMFSKSDEAELASVSKGQKITLRGEVSGKLGNILFRDCQIVK